MNRRELRLVLLEGGPLLILLGLREGHALRPSRRRFAVDDEGEQGAATATCEQPMTPGQRVHALLAPDADRDYFVVTNCEGRQVGVIRDESGRVLAESLRQNSLCAVPLTVQVIVPIVGDARVQITPE